MRLLEIIGLINTFFIFKNYRELPAPLFWLYVFLFSNHVFIRICERIRWYSNEPRGAGIEVHFQRSVVPASFILAVVSSLLFLKISVLSYSLVLIADIILFFISLVNGIQIYFHSQDRDSLPINYFSRNKYLSEAK